MRFKTIKPLHGWREFVGEVGIIVLGVLIALAAQQVAQSVQERGEARDADQAVRGEIEQNLGKLKSRWGIWACVEKRSPRRCDRHPELGGEATILDNADGTLAGQFPSWPGGASEAR